MVLGGPLPHVMAAKAVAFAEARRPSFAAYAARIVANARALAEGLLRRGARLVTGGTDNHIVLMDVAASFGLTGRQAESALLDAGVVTNRNSVPGDQNGAWYTSGIRLGTPALTTLGFGPDELEEVADVITAALRATAPAAATARAKYTLDPEVAARSRARCADLLGRHPLYPGISL
jgi:glycine hydroxymethyltransferase